MNTSEVLNSIWQEFAKAKKDKEHPFRFGTLGTINENGVNMRTVVIRKVIAEAQELWFYTDYRTPKVSEIKNNKNIAWHFYHPKQQIQIRLYGTAEIFYNESLNQEIWNNLPDYGKADYLSKKPPGMAKTVGNVEILAKANSANFCIIKTKINKIDWLKLNRETHQRAAFQFIDNQWIGAELIP